MQILICVECSILSAACHTPIIIVQAHLHCKPWANNNHFARKNISFICTYNKPLLHVSFQSTLLIFKYMVTKWQGLGFRLVISHQNSYPPDRTTYLLYPCWKLIFNILSGCTQRLQPNDIWDSLKSPRNHCTQIYKVYTWNMPMTHWVCNLHFCGCSDLLCYLI